MLALPDMMESAGIPIDQLQRGAPIVSGFLLGYVAMLPLIGRIADLRGRVPVLVAALVLFAVGSLVTTAAYDLPSLVAGRFLQGVGAGGLVPATLALVADLYPVDRRGVPLGIVSAVQELGSVIGPLYGALILAVSDWRVIFAVNLVVGVVLAVLVRSLGSGEAPDRPADPAPATAAAATVDWAGIVCLRRLRWPRPDSSSSSPTSLVIDVTWGQLFIPVAGSGRWLTPLGLVAVVAALLFLVRCWTARRPLVDLRGLVGGGPAGRPARRAVPGRRARRRDPRLRHRRPAGGGVRAAGLVVPPRGGRRHRRLRLAPAHRRGAARPARRACVVRRPGGRSLVSFFVGAALVAALIDIPIFARTTVYPDSQLLAALVLVRFLVALPVGAVVGGYLTRRVAAGRGHRGRHGARRVRVRADEPLGPHLALRLAGHRPARRRRLRLRPRARARSTPRCWPRPTPACTGSPAPASSSPG